MSHIRYRDDDSSARGALFLVVGALAGLAAGVVLAERFGGLSGLTGGLSDRVRERVARSRRDESVPDDEFADEDEDYELSPEEELEERVLEAFRNDPILSERAVDIGAITEDTIELSGWVHTPEETDHAVTIARGTPGVENVVNRLDVRLEDIQLAEVAEEYESEPTAAEGRWEGQQVGTGRRRQGSSAERDRHDDPMPELQDKWLSTGRSLDDAAEDVNVGTGNRRAGSRRPPKGDRTGGSPVSPTGVPKGDHVADPSQAVDPSETIDRPRAD
ncbi:MAG TPA: BON domain-containing protein [Gemmatimonadaceae bacterium]|jgi:hypothetical protein|nr:BON domain-containing protein [Gemmatimonadaceae bacterium]